MPLFCDPAITTASGPSLVASGKCKDGNVKKSYPPEGVYYKAGEVSEALNMMTSEDEQEDGDDESSESSSSSNSDSSFHASIDQVLKRRSSPRKPAQTVTHSNGCVARPLRPSSKPQPATTSAAPVPAAAVSAASIASASPPKDYSSSINGSCISAGTLAKALQPNGTAKARDKSKNATTNPPTRTVPRRTSSDRGASAAGKKTGPSCSSLPVSASPAAQRPAVTASDKVNVPQSSSSTTSTLRNGCSPKALDASAATASRISDTAKTPKSVSGKSVLGPKVVPEKKVAVKTAPSASPASSPKIKLTKSSPIVDGTKPPSSGSSTDVNSQGQTTLDRKSPAKPKTSASSSHLPDDSTSDLERTANIKPAKDGSSSTPPKAPGVDPTASLLPGQVQKTAVKSETVPAVSSGPAVVDDKEPESGSSTRQPNPARRLRSSTPRNLPETKCPPTVNSVAGRHLPSETVVVSQTSVAAVEAVAADKKGTVRAGDNAIGIKADLPSSANVIGPLATKESDSVRNASPIADHATDQCHKVASPLDSADATATCNGMDTEHFQDDHTMRDRASTEGSSSQGDGSCSQQSRSASKFDQIWKSKCRSNLPLSISPDFPTTNANNGGLSTEREAVSLAGRKRRQPRERFSPDTFSSRRSKSIRSPTSPKSLHKKARHGVLLDMLSVTDLLPSLEAIGLETKRKKPLQKKIRTPAEEAERKARKTEAQRRRRRAAAAAAAAAKLGLVVNNGPGTPNGVDAGKFPEFADTPPVVPKPFASGTRKGAEDSSMKAEGAGNAVSPVDPDDPFAHDIFSPAASVGSYGDSSNGKPFVRKPKVVNLPINNIKPNLKGFFNNQHPLIAVRSRRKMVDDMTLTDLNSGLPRELPERTLLSVMTSGPLVGTQADVVHARRRYLLGARLLLRRSLSYNVGTRRFRAPASFEQRVVATKKRNLECFVQQLWERRLGGEEKNSRPSYLYPIDLEVTAFNLLKGVEGATSGASSSPTPPSRKEIDVQFAVLKKNPKETLVKDLLAPILTSAVKMRGVSMGGKTVTFSQKNRVRLEYWNLNDFLVVNTEWISSKTPAKVVAFSVGDIKDGLVLEVAGHFSLRVLIRKPLPAPSSARVDYKFVIIYATGEHYQVRDMVAIKHHLKGHACILCEMRCDSLCSLLRHLEGLHPSVGHEYDDDTKRLYIWFAPDSDFVRAPVPGVVDHWGGLRFSLREDGSTLVYPDSLLGRFPDGRPVFQWMSARYIPSQPSDSLPKFDLHHVLKVYGLAVNPVQQYLHTNPVQTIRPDYDHLRGYDSDEDTSWQDPYEHEKIHDFIDCNPQEKHFMCLWNTFTRRISPIFSIHMKEVLCRFVVQHATEIEIFEGYPALCAQLSIFRRNGVITPAESLEVVTRYRSTLLCQNQALVANQLSHKEGAIGGGGGEMAL